MRVFAPRDPAETTHSDPEEPRADGRGERGEPAQAGNSRARWFCDGSVKSRPAPDRHNPNSTCICSCSAPQNCCTGSRAAAKCDRSRCSALHAAAASRRRPCPRCAARARRGPAPRPRRRDPDRTCPLCRARVVRQLRPSSTIDRVLQSQRYPPKTCFEDEPVLQVARRLLGDGGVDGRPRRSCTRAGREARRHLHRERLPARRPPPDCGEVVDEQLARAVETARERRRLSSLGASRNDAMRARARFSPSRR